MRTVTAVLAWLGALVAATAVGLAAVTAIGVEIVGPDRQVLQPAEVDARLAAAPGAPAPPTAIPAPTAAPPDPTPVGTAEVIVSDGGTVVARCAGGAPQVVSASPAQGFRIHDEDDEERGRVRFESDRLEVELRLSCATGRPTAEVRTEVDD